MHSPLSHCHSFIKHDPPLGGLTARMTHVVVDVDVWLLLLLMWVYVVLCVCGDNCCMFVFPTMSMMEMRN